MQKLDEYISWVYSTNIRTDYNYIGVVTENDIPPYPKFLKIDLSKNIIECPIGMLKICASTKIRGYTSLVRPLVIPNSLPAQNKRTMSSILNELKRHHRNMCQVLHDNDAYYSLPGILFDHDFNVIMSINGIIEDSGRVYILNRIVCRLSSKVIDSTKYVEKNIVKQFIPYLVNRKFMPWEDARLGNVTVGDDARNKGMQIIIDDYSDIIEEIAPPKVTEMNTDIVKQVLKDNITKVIRT